MNKGFWKGLRNSFIATFPLYLMLNGVFWIIQKMGLVKEGMNIGLFIGLYAVVILSYLILAKMYFRKKSANNLQKLKREVEEVTGKKLT
ncbi:MAG: hypothetical protein AAB414_00090 [Patescibacteria group bacterium]